MFSLMKDAVCGDGLVVRLGPNHFRLGPWLENKDPTNPEAQNNNNKKYSLQ